MSTVTLCIGHSSKERGATTLDKSFSEYWYNKNLVDLVKSELIKEDIKVHVVNRLTDGNGTGMTADIRAVNKYETDCIVELHCNAFDSKTAGCETLFWHRSKKGKKLAELVQAEMCKALGNNNRGIKPITTKGRGAAVLRGSFAPMIMTEPFFIDNPTEFNNGVTKMDYLARAISRGVVAFLRGN